MALAGGKKLKPKEASTRELVRAAKAVRQATPSKEKRGRRVDAAERAVGEALAKRLHALGVKDAKVTVLAGAPGKGARVRIEGVEVAKLGVLGKAIGAVVR